MDRILAGGKKVKLVIDLLPTSWVFKKGHRIRVSIAGADWPTFQLHPKLSPTNNPNDQNNIVPAITVCHRDGRYEGSTELYTFRDDVYLPYEDQWLRWKTKKNWERGSVEIYKCEGEPGK